MIEGHLFLGIGRVIKTNGLNDALVRVARVELHGR